MATFDPVNLKFEILCIDQKGNVNFSSEKNLLRHYHLMSSFGMK
jgi:hypothetical protein